MKYCIIRFVFSICFLHCNTTNAQKQNVIPYPATLLKTNTLNFLFQGFSLAAEQKFSNHHSLQFNYFQGHYNFISQNRMQGANLGYRYTFNGNQFYWGKGVYTGLSATYQYECDRYNQATQQVGKGFWGPRLDAGYQYLSPKKWYVLEGGIGYLVKMVTSPIDGNIYPEGNLRLNLSVGLQLNKILNY
jgi:Protein of unknown function (DUF3575)